MVSCLPTTRMTLKQRLRQFVGKRIELAGAGFSLEPGLLQKVCPRNFIVVQGENFVPLTLDTMVISNVNRSPRFIKVGISTTFASNNRFFGVQLVRVGIDFIEIQGRKGNPRSRTLIPLNKVGRIFKL